MATGSIFKLDVLGDKTLEARLNALPEKVKRRLLRTTLRSAFKRTLDRARAAAPRNTGALARSLKLRAGRSRGGIVQYKIFTEDLKGLGYRATKRLKVRGGRGQGFPPAAIEFGYVREYRGPAMRRTGYVRKDGTATMRPSRSTGASVRVPARPFMRGSLASTRDEVLEAVRKDLAEGITELAGKDGGGE